MRHLVLTSKSAH